MTVKLLANILVEQEVEIRTFLLYFQTRLGSFPQMMSVPIHWAKGKWWQKTLDQQLKPPFQLERSMLKIPESDEMFCYLVWCVDYGYTDI